MSIRRARPPSWWLEMVSKLPKFEVPWLTPRHWTRELAEQWVNSIPAKCPFEREVRIRGILVLYIPPLCPLNPLSTQFYRTRLEAQEYLATQGRDEGG